MIGTHPHCPQGWEDYFGIVIDNAPEREAHNREIVGYLKDKVKYDDNLRSICESLGRKEMTIIDKTFHPQTIKICTKALWNCWKKKLQKKNFVNDYSLQRLLAHDQRRKILMRTIEKY